MPEVTERLHDCLENTDWNVFNDGNNLHIFTGTVTAYVGICQDVCVPSKSVTKYPTNSTFCSKIFKSKDEAIQAMSNDTKRFHRTKGDIRKPVRDAKGALKDRLEKKLASNNSRDIWSSIDSITSYKGLNTTVSSDDSTLPNKLCDYYVRFDKGNLCPSFFV